MYTCNNGYNLTGDMTRTCQANGTWTGTVQICDRKSFTSKCDSSYLENALANNYMHSLFL